MPLLGVLEAHPVATWLETMTPRCQEEPQEARWNVTEPSSSLHGWGD